MAFADFFKPQQSKIQATPGNPSGGNPQPNQPGGNNPGGNATLPNIGNNQPGNGNNQNTGTQTPANPLDNFTKLWDTPTTEGDKAPTFSIDPKVMDQVVSSQDFTQGIDPEVMQKATSGDMQAMMQIIQMVGRNSYRASLEHGGMLTDKFVGAREKYGEKAISSKVRSELTTHALSSTPNFQHPVVKKQLTMIAQQFQMQHPDASPEEIANMSKQYMTELTKAINPTSESDKNGNQKPNVEERGAEFWDKFFDEEPSA